MGVRGAEFARARNAAWAQAQLDGGGLIVVAAGRQVAAPAPGAAPSMGNFLRQWLGADYRAIGASFAGGQVRGDALVGAADVWIDLRGRTGVWARPLRLGGETLRPAAAFDAIAAFVHVEPAQCTEGDARAGVGFSSSTIDCVAW